MAIFTHSPRDSSHVKSFSYDDLDHTMSVTFDHARLKAPATYVHADVPEDIFGAWQKWDKAGHSAGDYYHRFIKNFPRAANPEKK